MPVSVLSGIIATAVIPSSRKGAGEAINAGVRVIGGAIRGGINGAPRNKQEAQIICQIQRCRYTIEEVQFHDDVSKNSTASDVEVHFPTPDAVNRHVVTPKSVCGIPSFKFEPCNNDLKTVVIKTSVPGLGRKFHCLLDERILYDKLCADFYVAEAKFHGIPASCMELSTVMVNRCGAPSHLSPKTCGHDCLHYAQLNPEQLSVLTSVLTPA